MTNGRTVAAFEREFASFVGAQYAIAASNGTVTLQAALVALRYAPGDPVSVPPLTMAATTIAALNVGLVPQFVDVRADTWLKDEGAKGDGAALGIYVSLYGLHTGEECSEIDDAAQTLRPHGAAAFTSYSFQASKILALGEGGMLVTNDRDLAARARSYLSLGYDLPADTSRIAPERIKASDYTRHYLARSINGRMNDLTAEEGLRQLDLAAGNLMLRQMCATGYREAFVNCEWATPQYVPQGWTHDYWTFAVACDTTARARWLADAVVRHGGERPYAAWRLTYHEPAFAHLEASCPVAASLQPRLLQFQTNNLHAANENARAVALAIAELG